MNMQLTAALRLAENLVDMLRACLADADPVAAILIIQQIEDACAVRGALGQIVSAIDCGDVAQST